MLEKLLVSLLDATTNVLRDQRKRIADLEDELADEREYSDMYLEQLKLSMASNSRKRAELRLQSERLEARP